MAKKPYKIRESASLMLAAIVVVGGAFTLLASPIQSESVDQKRLQQELQENAALLENSGGSEPSVVSVPPVIPNAPIVTVPPENNTQEKNSLTFTAIGDSVMLGAVPEIQRVLPGGIIDAKEFRQVWDTISVISDLDTKGKLLDTVVIALGGNGSFSKSSGQELVDALGSERTIYWIAPFGKFLTWQDSTLKILRELAEENENLTILDWPETASKHTDWFYDDGMHLNTAGQTGYAEFVLEHLGVEQSPAEHSSVSCRGAKPIIIDGYVEFLFLNWDGLPKTLANYDARLKTKRF